jgi:DNA-directed RNA polymerase subunit beta'
MVITQTVTKKILETIVQKTFSNFGNLSCSSLLDSLKLLGFYYATNAGISINIEDLKTPNVKKEFLNQANDEMMFISEQWQQGNVSDTERFQTIIDSWNIATETLKNRIVDYYENFDPANNLYIMAFSGARGNMSQVRQLVGMRGLMSDQEGKIIDLPIQANFREGLSSIDYIISSYGARKGIVDTALKTADSGYLTRRLIYIAQDLVIREIDCFTTSGVIVLVNEKSTAKNIIGRTVISMKEINKEHVLEEKDFILTTENFKKLKKVVPLFLNLRSVLTCKSNGSICQKCYGWDLAHNKMVSLGEAVGIIAAQSIGEPGTQLTMRTFHTGGIFTSESVKQITAPYSGKISIPDSLKTIPYRTNHGNLVSRLQQETIITIINWKGQKEEIFLEIGSFLYIKSSSFVKKGQLISEYSGQSIVSGARRLKPIYTTTMGEVWFENLILLLLF